MDPILQQPTKDGTATMRTTRPAPIASTSPHRAGFGLLPGEAATGKPTAEQLAQFKAGYKLAVEEARRADAIRNAKQGAVDALQTSVDGQKDKDLKATAVKELESAKKDLATAEADSRTAHDALMKAIADHETALDGKMPPAPVPPVLAVTEGQGGDKNPDGTPKVPVK